MKTVRAFSEAGPCITLGAVLRETDHCVSYRDCQGATTLISIDRTVHTEPCPSCPDHPRTKYRYGYWGVMQKGSATSPALGQSEKMTRAGWYCSPQRCRANRSGVLETKLSNIVEPTIDVR